MDKTTAKEEYKRYKKRAQAYNRQMLNLTGGKLGIMSENEFIAQYAKPSVKPANTGDKHWETGK